MPITPGQLRAGRHLAGLGIRELSKLAGVSTNRIHAIENGRIENPRPRTVECIKQALESRGIEFKADGWVRHSEDGKAAATNTHDDGLG